MTEHERAIERLVREQGVSREDAEGRFVDDDLWILWPESRYSFEPEEAVEEWKQAYAFVHCLAEGFTASIPTPANQATNQLLWDAEARAAEALRRAEERAKA